MINENRIVPVVKIDLISLYGLILLQDSNNANLTKLEASTVAGDFFVDDGTNPLIADQPVKSVDCDFSDGTSMETAALYFVASNDFAGFTVNGEAVETTGDDIVADGVTLYKATAGDGVIEIAKIGF